MLKVRFDLLERIRIADRVTPSARRGVSVALRGVAYPALPEIVERDHDLVECCLGTLRAYFVAGTRRWRIVSSTRGVASLRRCG